MRRLVLLFILFGVIIIAGCATEEENTGVKTSSPQEGLHAGHSGCH